MNSCLSTNRKQRKLSWRRIAAISDYIKKLGIPANRIVFVYDGYPEECNIIEMYFHKDTNSVPARHPNFSKSRE
jgi:hypothetical protein